MLKLVTVTMSLLPSVFYFTMSLLPSGIS
jgi:hypothetical protein